MCMSVFLCVSGEGVCAYQCRCLWRSEEAIGFSGLEGQVLGSHLRPRSWTSNMFQAWSSELRTDLSFLDFSHCDEH